MSCSVLSLTWRQNESTAAPMALLMRYVGGHRKDGSRWVMFSFFGGARGHPGKGRPEPWNAPISTATIPPGEILEAAYPMIFTQWALRPDSGAPGAPGADLARYTR
ncbi:MAG: hypothetical protein CM1200mP18_19350 [Gammaproteobacteria bacterium]|nr:MAG: hypothetical protein CM1200mP18_19350 [Gammaproteobacteria bacterium]